MLETIRILLFLVSSILLYRMLEQAVNQKTSVWGFRRWFCRNVPLFQKRFTGFVNIACADSQDDITRLGDPAQIGRHIL